MKRWLSLFCLLTLSITLASPAAAQTPGITLVNPPPGGVLELGVGESYTFVIEFESDEPYNMAQVGLAPYYPGRYVYSTGIVSAHKGTSATLSITVTAKSETADLPDGVLPLTLVAAMRYPANEKVVEEYLISVIVK